VTDHHHHEDVLFERSNAYLIEQHLVDEHGCRNLTSWAEVPRHGEYLVEIHESHHAGTGGRL
jgi:hypothetical protein